MGFWGSHSASTTEAPGPMRHRRHAVNVAESMRRYKRMIDHMPRFYIERVDHNEGIIGVERRSMWQWAFADISISFTAVGESTLVKVWVESRKWSFDFGMNHRHLQKLLQAVDREFRE